MNDWHCGYEIARERFLASAQAKGPELLQSIQLSLEPGLFIDIAHFGSRNPQNLLFHVSGTHGVEGFVGSAIQSELLGSSWHLPNDTAIVFIHGLNPYGMKMLRRVNESNVDLNRNFLLSGEEYYGAPGLYAELDPILNPLEHFEPEQLRSIAERYSEEELKTAILTGQYEFPKGLFFGGKKLEEGPRLLLEWLEGRFAEVTRVVGIEVHTGLGNYGEQMLLSECSQSGLKKRGEFEALIEHPLIIEKKEAGGYPVRGGVAGAMVEGFAGMEAIWMVQEFGTHPPLQMLGVFCEENFYFHQGAGPDHNSRIKLLHSFCPTEPGWKEKVLEQGRFLFTDSLKFLAVNSKAS